MLKLYTGSFWGKLPASQIPVGFASTSCHGCPGPALADTLAPDPLCLCNWHHPGAAPIVAPHTDVHLVEPAAIAPVPSSSSFYFIWLDPDFALPLSHCMSVEAVPRLWLSLKLCGIVWWLWNTEWGGCTPARLPQGRCRGRAGAVCWPSHRGMSTLACCMIQ
jgi:hypothetical protein